MGEKQTLDELRAKESYLYDKFTRAAPSRSAALLKEMCEVSAQIAKLKKEKRQSKESAS